MTISTGIFTTKFASVEFVIIFVYVGFVAKFVIVFVYVDITVKFVIVFVYVGFDSLMIKDDKFLIISFNHFPLHSVQTSICNVYKEIIDNDCYIMHSVKRNVVVTKNE